MLESTLSKSEIGEMYYPIFVFCIMCFVDFGIETILT